ncbi:hypothetical protein, partial [Streptomyces sp. 8P21H-1]|uniref:hypothetical protein n=1 Tax=Streptomyces sp. 8P21H-1 TaxID=2737048 RepID=UPI00156F1997
MGVGSGAGRVGVGGAFVGDGTRGLGFFPSSSWSLPGFSGAADRLAPLLRADGDAGPDADLLGFALACFPSLAPCRPGRAP